MSKNEKILVVDDDKFNVALLRDLCESAGYQVIEANTGEDAIQKAIDNSPDLVLLDIMMPGKDGFEVCKELRADENTSGLPIIIVTALDDLESKVKGIELGADDYVTKPFRLFELQQRIRTAIETRRYRLQLRNAEEQLRKLGEYDTPGRIGGFRQLRCGLEYEYQRANRYEHPLSCFLFSIDDYDKTLNEQGKKAVASIVGRVVTVLKGKLRSVDRVYRLDNEQFIIILPETNIPGARTAINRICKDLKESIPSDKSPITLTVALVGFPHPRVQTGQDILRALSDLQNKFPELSGDQVLELNHLD